MRRSRAVLLAALPAYGMLALPLPQTVLDAAPRADAPEPVIALTSALFSALFLSNLAVNFFMFPISDMLRPHWSIVVASYVALNLAFWLPLAHLADARLEMRRTRERA